MAGNSTKVNEATAWKIQGNINYKQGNYEYALIFYDNGLQADPENTDILNNKGMTLLKLGRMDEARQCQRELKRLKEMNHVVAATGPGTSGQCTVKIKGMDGSSPARDVSSDASSPGSAGNALMGDLEIQDLEQNIESIQKGIDKVRLGRIKEAQDCQVRIREMEGNLELTKQGLEMVKQSRIEEDKKIQIIEENLDLTRKGLDMIKLGRTKEATYYNLQLKEIEERIDSTRKNLKQINVKRAENVAVLGAPVTGSAGNTVSIPASIVADPPVSVGNEQQSTTGAANTGNPVTGADESQPVTPNRIVFVTVIIIVVIVLILTYFNFFK